jgi:hypothetical protein
MMVDLDISPLPAREYVIDASDVRMKTYLSQSTDHGTKEGQKELNEFNPWQDAGWDGTTQFFLKLTGIPCLAPVVPDEQEE